MRISFAGNWVAIGTRDRHNSAIAEIEPTSGAEFALFPRSVDLTPDYDPSARASELDILQAGELDLQRYSIELSWKRGGWAGARTQYADSRQILGLPKVEVSEFRTVLMVHDSTVYITCFLDDVEYSEMMRLCEKFASWPNPKCFHGRKQLTLLGSGLSAALDEEAYLSFWHGALPLYCAKAFQVSFRQNVDVPSAPSEAERHAYHLSQV